MNHLDNLTIHQFRGIKNLTLKDLGQINILVGVNNSGKTSVLEAISTYCRPLDPLEWLNTAWRREIKFYRTTQLEALRWLFPQTHSEPNNDLYRGEILVTGTGEFPVQSCQAIYQEFEGINRFQDVSIGDNPEEDKNLEDSSTFDSAKGVDLELKITFQETTFSVSENPIQESAEKFQIMENERFIHRKNRSHPALSVETVTPYSHRSEQLQVGLLSEATLQGFKQEVIKLLNILDSRIVDLQILSPKPSRPIIYLDHRKIGLSPVSVFGDGIRRLLFIALTLAKVRGGVLLIDELETAIHTEALQDSFSWLIQACQELKVQLFATTHSLETIDALLNVSNPNTNLALYRLEQQDSQTCAIRLGRERLHRLREDLGQEVRW